MARNRQIIRQLILLQLLDCRNGRTIDELAAESSVTTRTIRRDLAALEEAGIPLIDAVVEQVGALNYPTGDVRRWRVLKWRERGAA
jgi:predicted DNA-binding transcriptional regulator YafY